jgi:hypothetical protein
MRITILFFIISYSLSAQIKGVVKDSLTGKAISYVNIWVQNENIGASTEENGEFSINTTKTKNLIFSALGYEKKTIKAADAAIVNLKPTSYQLDEVIISKRFETKIIEIGKTKTAIYQAFDNGPRIDVKYFPYYPNFHVCVVVDNFYFLVAVYFCQCYSGSMSDMSYCYRREVMRIFQLEYKYYNDSYFYS